MDIKFCSVSVNSICEGCLSTDRAVQPLPNGESKNTYLEILEAAEHVNHPLLLCWECMARLRRFMEFRKQIKTAHIDLTQYFVHGRIDLKSLSKLSVSTQTVKKDLTEDTLKRENETVTEICADVAVKVESLDDTDRFYDDEKELFDDIKIEVDFKPDELPSGIKVKPKPAKRKTKKKKFRSKADEFDESDEEPLKAKKQKKGVSLKDKWEKKESERKRVGRAARAQAALRKLQVGGEQLTCVVLSWDEVHAEREKVLSSEKFSQHQYKCLDCVLGFNHRVKLENHMKKHDPSAGDSVCEICRVVCRDAKALAAHTRRHRLRWRCECGHTSSRASVAAEHRTRRHHAPPPTHTCAACGHRETSASRLRAHARQHAPRAPCPHCGRLLPRHTLPAHVLTHVGAREHACPACDKRFLYRAALVTHLVTHAAPALLYCHPCDMNFKNQMSYYQHLKYNLKHIDPAKLKHACTSCDKKFAKASRLREHNLAVHLKETPIRCPEENCDFACSSRAVLRSHARSRHRGGKVARLHMCHACGRAYATKKCLESHLRSHSEVKRNSGGKQTKKGKTPPETTTAQASVTEQKSPNGS